MAHNQRFAPDAFYVNGVAIPAKYFQAMNAASVAGINADAGGRWTPSSPLQIGGAGMGCAGPWTLGGGAKIVTPPGSGARVVFGANDAPMIDPDHQDLANRTLVTWCASQFTPLGTTRSVVPPVAQLFRVVGALTTARVNEHWIIPLRVHDGAVFKTVTLSFIPSPAHLALPATAPQMRIYAAGFDGSILPLGGPRFTPGWVSYPLPATFAAYSAAQQFVYPLFPGIVVNRSIANYFAEIIDESGVGAQPGNAYWNLTCSFGSISMLGVE